MIQTWILSEPHSPVDASKSGADAAVCGQCPQRKYHKGACYVVIGQGPQRVWRAYKKGIYPDYDPSAHTECFSGRRLRAGSYGDPAAVPYSVWAGVIGHCTAATGYTHQRRHPNFDRRIAEFCMVSVDTPLEAVRAHRSGFATYRIKRTGEPVLIDETQCPYPKTQCINCGLCSGIGSPNIVNDVHGASASRF